MSGPPPGVNMPKKRDPRLRGLQAPPEKQFFDSADYEVRKQQTHPQGPGGHAPQQQHQQHQQQQQQSVPSAPHRQVPPPPPSAN